MGHPRNVQDSGMNCDDDDDDDDDSDDELI